MAKPWAKAFYKSAAWQRARQIAIMRDRGMCQTAGCYNPAQEVHHVIQLTPDNIDNDDIATNADNLQCLCRDCHKRLHRSEKNKKFLENSGEKKREKDEVLPCLVFVNGVPRKKIKKKQL